MTNFEPLHPLFGVIVGDVDLTGPLADDVFAEIRAAFEKYSLLVFHDQPVSDEQQLAFSRRFGPLELTKIGALGAGTELVILTNVDPDAGPDGAIAPPEHRLHGSHRANSLWHTDSSFKKTPALASLLSGRVVPSVGAETEFASMRAAYAALPDETKQHIEGKVVMHSFANSRNQIDKDLASSAERDELPPVPHPMVKANPATGEKSFYLASHAAHIVGMPVEDGKSLIAELIDATTAADRVYRHAWREHDLVMWDNRCMLHRGQPFDDQKYRRHMIRTTVSDVDAGAEAAA
ncbi:MAG: TauD/TfdA family dioxygenase [Rhodospirillaceae bacterium]|jgi:alpha-ketoglutarate-dependent 2,4-dichlorophenoxyacetate dioxygenase|nr:TauD/TfdA family dioxygenase [Rhodospirillaceae bacterium]MBT5665125.1 TauD/TfdA family dioxygenase [Rhodospirillaceae bacterium]